MSAKHSHKTFPCQKGTVKMAKYYGAKLKLVGWNPCTEVYLMFNGACAKCSKLLTFEECTIEHLHPQSQRDTYTGKSVHEVENLTLLCFSCNARKGDKSALEFFGVETLEIIKAINSDRLPKSVIWEAAEGIAAQKPSGKYARLAAGGQYYRAA